MKSGRHNLPRSLAHRRVPSASGLPGTLLAVRLYLPERSPDPDYGFRCSTNQSRCGVTFGSKSGPE
jgi:hypothetical protein